MRSTGLSRADGATQLLSSLADGTRATVTRVVVASAEIDAVALRRLGELGFLPGEPVQLLRRGPGGREPLAVLIGETMFALRLLEAQCIEVDTSLLPARAAATPMAVADAAEQTPSTARAGAATVDAG
ncbi:MAG: FeoA family protein [Caldimonas sp.]